jgi:hypothetical protein
MPSPLKGLHMSAKDTRRESIVPSILFDFGSIVCGLFILHTRLTLRHYRLFAYTLFSLAGIHRQPCPYLTDVATFLKDRRMTTDKSGLVHHLGYADSLNVAISICLTYTLIFTCVRIHLRRSSFGADDAVVVVATIAAMAHFAASYTCLTAGLGKPYDMIKGNLDRLSSVGSGKMMALMITS